MEEAAFAAIKIQQLSIPASLEVDAGYGIGIGAEIFAKGQYVESAGKSRLASKTLHDDNSVD